MRYNYCDTNPTLFDLEGKPFFGKLVFVAPGTSRTYRNVFDVEDNNLGHVITTNQYGRIETQIILDGTYDIQYWSYTGSRFDINDDSQFTLIRTERAIDPSDNITLDVSGMATFCTVQDMRDFDVSGLHNHAVVLRTGYYTNGDHEQLMYYWDQESTSVDDGGYIIRPSNVTGKGRWVAVFPDHINVKWYGVKSSDLLSKVTYQSSALQAAKVRSLYMGKTLYFPAEEVRTFYGLDSVRLEVGNADIRLDAGVRLVCKQGTTNSIKCFNLYCDRDAQVIVETNDRTSCSVTADEVWTASMSNYGAITARRVHFNDSVRQANWSNCEIVFETAPMPTMGFDGCTLSFASEDCKFDPENVQYTFSNMVFNDTYFKSGSDINYGYINVSKTCYIDLESFSNSENWIDLMQDWGETSINCQGQRMDSVVVSIDTTLHNVNIGTVTTNGQSLRMDTGHVDGITYTGGSGTVELVGITVGGNNVPTSIDCWAFNCTDVKLNYASAVIKSGTATLYRSTFTCPITTRVFEASHCDFALAVTCRTFKSFYSTYAGTIYVKYYNNLSVICTNNTIGAQSTMQISREDGSTYEDVKATDCQWVNNTILNKSFWISIDRTHLHKDDTQHTYTYKGNTGACKQPGTPVVYGLKTVLGYDPNPSTRDQPYAGMYMTYEDFGEYGGKHIYSSVWDVWGNPFKDIFIFSIGNYNVSAYIDVEFIGFGVKYGTDDKMYDVPAVKLGSGYSWSFFVSDTDKILLSTDTEGSSVSASQLQWVSAYNWRLHTNHLDNKHLASSPKSVNAWRGSPMQYLDINSYNGGVVQYTKETWPNVTGYWRLTVTKK